MHHRPLVPEDVHPNGRSAALNSFCRACVASAVTIGRDISASEYIAKTWPVDRTCKLILRSPSGPTSVADATALATVSLALLDLLVPESAAADLFSRALQLSFDRSAQISVPTVALPSANFVGEGQPISIRIAATGPGQTLYPNKIGSAVVLSREMAEHTNAEPLFKRVLAESVGGSLDSLVFDNNPAVPDLRPAGLLDGILPLGGSTAPDLNEAMINDLQALASVVAPLSGNGGIVFVVAVAQSIRIETLPRFSYPVLKSSVLAPGTIVAVVPAAVVVALEAAPRIDVRTTGLAHLSDTQADVVDGAGNLAAPVESLWQIDSRAITLRWPISWALRRRRSRLDAERFMVMCNERS
jgi:hypothetical protein